MVKNIKSDIILRTDNYRCWKHHHAIQQEKDYVVCEWFLVLTMPVHWLRGTSDWFYSIRVYFHGVLGRSYPS